MTDETRTRMLLAAGPVFAAKGYDRATIREICDAAGVNLASVNYHFGDKHTLYIQTVRHARELRVEQVPWPELPSSASIGEQLLAYVETMLRRMLGADAEPWQTQLMMRELLDPTEDCRAMVEDFFRPRLNRLLQILNGIYPDSFDEARRHQFAFSVMGQCLFYRVGKGIVEIVISEQHRDEHFRIEQLARHITNLTLASLGHAPVQDEAALVSKVGDAS